MHQIETGIKATFGNLFSASVLSITTTEHDAPNSIITAVVQLVIAIATVISLFKKRSKNGKD